MNSQNPQYQDPQFYGDAPVPRRRRLDGWTIALLAAVGIAGCACLIAPPTGLTGWKLIRREDGSTRYVASLQGKFRRTTPIYGCT